MLFTDYIKDLGINKTSQLYNVSTVTVRSWLKLESTPNPFKSFEVVQRTDGLVSWGEIYEPYIKANIEQAPEENNEARKEEG